MLSSTRVSDFGGTAALVVRLLGIGAMLRLVDYSVVVPVPPVLAFRAFCDLTRLLNRGIYAEAVWIEGEPWRVGSRVRYVVKKPVAAVISAVVTSYDPGQSISVLNHGLGITAEQLITFRASSAESTTVRMVVEALGASREISETEVRRGEHVHALDGEIGQVQGFLVSPGDHRLTHVLLQEGQLWGRKEVAIPVDAVTGVDDGIRLKITKKQVEDLPPVD